MYNVVVFPTKPIPAEEQAQFTPDTFVCDESDIAQVVLNEVSPESYVIISAVKTYK